MCRKGDVGAYTINNVFIERTTTNVSDGNKGKVLSDFTKSLMSQSKIGKRRKDLEGCNNPMAKSARKINTSEGIFLSAADAARKLGLSKTTAYRRCSNPNFADWFYLNTNKA